jgi:DNA invertase Pin-like site-specific DNA recombinase
MIKEIMIHDQKNAVALFIATENTDAFAYQDKQTFIRDFALLHDIRIVGFLAIERFGIQNGITHAIELCSIHSARTLIIDDLRTFSLSHKDLVKLLGMLVSGNITIRFVSSNSILDHMVLNTMHHILMTSARMDNEIRSQKIKKSLVLKKRKGAKLGGRKFGSDTRETYVIHQILKLHSQGTSLLKICDLLAKNGIKTTQNKKWHPTTVKRILERMRKEIEIDSIG